MDRSCCVVRVIAHFFFARVLILVDGVSYTGNRVIAIVNTANMCLNGVKSAPNLISKTIVQVYI